MSFSGASFVRSSGFVGITNISLHMLNIWRVVALLLCVNSASSMEPLAMLASQPVWQAGEPMKVVVDYDGEQNRFCCAEGFYISRLQSQQRALWMKSQRCARPALMNGMVFAKLSWQIERLWTTVTAV